MTLSGLPPSQETPSPGQGAEHSPSCPPCLYCGGTEYQSLFTGVRDYLKYVPGAWEFHRCRGCGSATLAPHPLAEELAAFYPPVYGFTPEIGGASRLKKLLAAIEYRVFFAPQYGSQVRKTLGVTRAAAGARLLDIGCGRGLRLADFRSRGLEVHGMDFQPAVVEYVRDRLDIPAVCTDVPGLERHYEPGSFDLVSAFWVMEHLPSARGLVETMRRLVRPGGWLVLAVPQVDSLQAAYLGGRWVNVVEAPRHLSLPSRRGIHRLCAEAGLEEVRVLPDSSIACAGMVGLSLFPDAATAHLYGGGQAGALVKRILAAGVSLAAIPLSLAENYLLRRPASAIVFARRPPEKAVSGGKSSA